ncbi:DUF4912 domain-containing protein [Calditerricola satsumensis]|uniref:DUF4912 domain-containing protein n=1 Tax=Calditerricola satsumensis TaxID=373054 RepID=A0A8J3BB90_9BACI|nr:DUF4912 domain-containing protein [Calditerricola satsumensis]GGJ94921.1 hypothetical protein GCM10007043_05900 [Calditerricola satsumensis]
MTVPLSAFSSHRSADQTQLVALVQNPHTIFVYWEIGEDRRKLAEEITGCAWEELSFFLRVHQMGDGGGKGGLETVGVWDIPVHRDANNWYIHALTPGAFYRIHYGVRTERHAFFTLLYSRLLQTPWTSPDAYIPYPGQEGPLVVPPTRYELTRLLSARASETSPKDQQANG